MREKVIAILKRHTRNAAIPDSDVSLFDEGYLDSFALPEFIAELEHEFGIKIPDSDLNPRKFETLDRIEQYVAGRL